MYNLRIGREHSYTLSSVKEAFELAIDYFKHGAECDVVDMITGEILLSLRDCELPYVASSIRYMY